MYHHQQQPSFTYLTHEAQSSTTNMYLSIPQPVPPSSLVSVPAIHPPGTDPYANSGPYPLTQVGIGSQPQLYEDPNVGSRSWVTDQTDPITYGGAVSLISTSMSSSINSNWTIQPLVNDMTAGIPQQGQIDIGQQITYGASGVAAGPELEIKRQKLLSGGAAVDSVRFCTICNIACNSQEVFAKHLAGKKHAAQAGLISLDGVGSYFAAIRAQNNSFWNKGPKKIKVVQSAWCDVCKINCNNKDAYAKHLVGKRHQKNLEKLEKSKNGTSDPSSGAAPAATIPTIGPAENPEAKKSYGVDSKKSQKRPVESPAPTEDLETKKRKVVESGAAAGAVRVCTICNVVCNSQTVFHSHISGQKHAAMVKKQAEARMAVAAPQLVTVL